VRAAHQKLDDHPRYLGIFIEAPGVAVGFYSDRGSPISRGRNARLERLVEFLAGAAVRRIARNVAPDQSRREAALALWSQFKSLAGDAFESEAARFLITCIEAESAFAKAEPTRAERRARDEAVIRAAKVLHATLVEEHDLLPVPSSRYWKPEYRDGIESMLRGVPPPTHELPQPDTSETPLPWWRPGTRPPKPGWGSACHFQDDPQPDEGDAGLSFWLVTRNAPTIAHLLDGLIRHAEAHSLARLKERKGRVSGNSGSIVRLTSTLSADLLVRFPSASSAAIARVVAPVIEFLLDEDDLLERVEKQIRRLNA
jgi:hypothetical protein